MFWHNNYAPSIQIDSLLSEEDITLNKLMDAEDILQECKSQNKKLIDFLSRSDILEELVDLITEEPSLELEERWRYKYSNVACELLTCDIPVLTEKLASNEILLSKLYSFIDQEGPLNPLLASFFSKTLHSLLRRASDQNWISHQFVCLQVLESLKSRKNCVDLLLQHVQTSAIMDLILILLTKIEDDEMRQNILNWLDDQQLVQRLVKLLSPYSNPENHTNVSQLLCDIVKSPRMEPEKRPDPVLQTLQSKETIKLLLDTVLSGEKVESSIIGGVRILINLLGQKMSSVIESSETYGVPYNNTVEDEERDKIALIIIPYLNKFNELLLCPPEKPAVKTTAGIFKKPFGRTRLYIMKLFVSLLSTGNSVVLETFADLNTFNILLDLFFQYAWNNFLHTQVQQCFSLALNSDYARTDEKIYHNIFIQCKYIEKILEPWDDSTNNTLNDQIKIRQGYMGHLIIMANEIVKRRRECNVLTNFFRTNLSNEIVQKWDLFTMSKLDEINQKQQLTLGESSGDLISSSGNSDDDASFHPDAYSEELYPSYLESSTVPVFVDDDYSFRGKKFNNGENTFQNIDQLNNQSFNLSNNDYEKRQELFNKICSDKKFNSTEDDEWQTGDFEIDKSDEEDEDEYHNLVVDNNDPWNSMKSLSVSDVAPVSLWNAEVPEPVEQVGWANFDNFNNTFGTDIGFPNEIHNEFKDELLEPSTTNENVPLPLSEISSITNSTESGENINKIVDVESKCEEIDKFSVTNSDYTQTPVNISDGNANLTTMDTRTSVSKNLTKNLEECSSNVLKVSSNNTNLDDISKTTSNEISVAVDVPEPLN